LAGCVTTNCIVGPVYLS